VQKEIKMKNLFFALLFVFSVATPAMAEEGMIHVLSSFSVQKTADRLENILSEKGMTIFKRMNHSEGASKVGIELRDTVLIIFGNPKVGSPLMKCQQTIAIDLPQKALIWEDEKANVWISYNDPSYIKNRHKVTGCEDVFSKVEKALAGITQSAATLH
jgi:uncharacterized protein (DUF302 family)